MVEIMLFLFKFAVGLSIMQKANLYEKENRSVHHCVGAIRDYFGLWQ
jgi:hypothetical protein